MTVDSLETPHPPPKVVKVIPSVSERLRYKQDSVRGLAVPGQISQEPLVLEKVVLHFNFEFGSAEIDASGAQYLDELAAAFLENPELKIRLVGHTDNTGAEKFNQRLSLQRAGRIRDVLVDKGVRPDRIEVDGKGETQPLVPNDTNEGRSRNRRVELTILYDQ